MIEKLVEILVREEVALIKLLSLLDKQYKLIMSKDIFGLEAIVEDFKKCNREVAEIEVERRRLLGKEIIREVIEKSNNEELDTVFRRIQGILHELTLQKDTNDLLLKQQLSFTNKLLTVINPRREVSVYNSYGNIKR